MLSIGLVVGLVLLSTPSSFMASAGDKSSYLIESSYGERQRGASKQVAAKAAYPFDSLVAWQVIADFESYPKFLPRVVAVEYLGEAKRGSSYYVKVALPSPFSDVWNILAVNVNEDLRTIDWRMIEGNLQRNVGRAKLVTLDGVAQFEIEIELRVGRLIPDSVVGWAAKKYLPTILIKMGDQIKARLNPLKRPARRLSKGI